MQSWESTECPSNGSSPFRLTWSSAAGGSAEWISRSAPARRISFPIQVHRSDRLLQLVLCSMLAGTWERDGVHELVVSMFATQ